MPEVPQKYIMMKAIWNNQVIAESNDTVVVGINNYFHEDAVNKEYLKSSDTHSVCSWKGKASYYNIEVDGKVNEDAAWYYPEPKEAAKQIKSRVAFWRGIII